MRYKARAIARTIDNADQKNPYDGSSLVPMLVAGLALTLIGMIAAVLLS
jgi:hypothetical protein